MPCYLQNADFTSGGGFSQVEPQPSYQAATVQAYIKSGVAIPPPSKFNSSNRGYPGAYLLFTLHRGFFQSIFGSHLVQISVPSARTLSSS